MLKRFLYPSGLGSGAEGTGPVITDNVIYFQDDFETGNFSKWDNNQADNCSSPPLGTIAVTTTLPYGGSYSSEARYYMDSSGTCSPTGHAQRIACDKWFQASTGYPNGLEEFYIRGYHRFHINPGGTEITIVGRKLFYFLDPTDAWHGVIATALGSHAYSLSFDKGGDTVNFGSGSVRNGVPAPTSGVGLAWSVVYNWQVDTWYYIEAYVKANSPAASGPYDGACTVWVQGLGVDPSPIEILRVTNANFRSTLTTGIRAIRVGEQTARNTNELIDEQRYWDNVVIANYRIGP